MRNIKNKFINKSLVISSIVCLSPVIIGFIYYNSMPEMIPSNFNFNNEPNRFMDKDIMLFAFPLLMSALQIFLCLVIDLKTGTENKKIKIVAVTKWIIPIIDICCYTATVLYSMNNNTDIRKWICIALSAIFILIGISILNMDFETAKRVMNPPPKTKESFDMQAEILGKTMIIGGTILFISCFMKPIFSIIVLIGLIPAIIAEGIIMYKK